LAPVTRAIADVDEQAIWRASDDEIAKRNRSFGFSSVTTGVRRSLGTVDVKGRRGVGWPIMGSVAARIVRPKLKLLGYRALPVAALPTVDFPTIQVSAQLPGASPQTMASSVATPLEKQFSNIAGIQLMTSSSSAGSRASAVRDSRTPRWCASSSRSAR